MSFAVEFEMFWDSLDTNLISGRDPINGQPLVDPIGKGGPLPLDVKRIIFQNSKAYLPSLALVSKNWKVMADDKGLREMIRPAQAFGAKEWKEYIGVDTENEPCLPRHAYSDLDTDSALLTFIPDKVKLTKENGVIEEVLLDNLEVIGKLVENPKKGNKTGYTTDSWKEAILEKRKKEKPHWVWISKKVIGRYQNYFEQQRLVAEEENKTTHVAKISGLIDTVISVFMEYIRSGKRNFIWDFHHKNTFPRTFVRVNEQTGGLRLGLGFTHDDGLHINNDLYATLSGLGVVVVLSRKSI